jgi:hypothetical protein
MSLYVEGVRDGQIGQIFRDDPCEKEDARRGQIIDRKGFL